MSNERKSFATKLTAEQVEKLRLLLANNSSWEFNSPPPYVMWKVRRENVVVTAYESLKITVQGKGTEDFIQFVLEPEITGVLEDSSSVCEQEIIVPDLKEAHAGIDESGKGDFFGPLVVAAVFIDQTMLDELMDIGVKDSKSIKSDKKISLIAKGVRRILAGKFDVLVIGPEAYNRLYEKIGNLNKLLGWGHARVLENLLEKVPECRLALSDKFAKESVIIDALMEKGRSVKLLQRTKGERDLAVAAASILARDEFVRNMRSLGSPLGQVLPKGASKLVEEVARDLVDIHGVDILRTVAKTHFKTMAKVLDN
jgi:ribonuclease HIII